MAFDRDSLATYEQQPQTMVEIPTPPVEVASDTPPPAENTEVDPAAAPAAESTDPASDLAGGESSGDETDEGAPTSPGEPSAATDAPPKGSARARIMELVDEKNSYRDFGKLQAAENARLRAELEAARAGKPVTPAAPAEEPAAAAPADDDVPPSPEDPDVQYDPVTLQQKNVESIRKQIAKGLSAELAKAKTTTAAETAQAAIAQKFQASATEFAKVTPDFKAVIGNKELPQLDPMARAVIVQDDQSAQLLYEIAKDVNVAKEIAALPPPLQLLRIGAIKARLAQPATSVTPAVPTTPAKPPVKQPKTVTSAPPPPTRVPAGAAPNTETPLSDESLSMEEFVKRDRANKAAIRASKREARLGMR